MALLKFFLGNSSDLANIPPIDGYLYFCTDNSNFYIDCYDPVQGAVVRKVVGGDQGNVEIDTSNLVTLDTAQTITGAKTFNKLVDVLQDLSTGTTLSGSLIAIDTSIDPSSYRTKKLLTSTNYYIKVMGPPISVKIYNTSSGAQIGDALFSNGVWNATTLPSDLTFSMININSSSDLEFVANDIFKYKATTSELNFNFPQNYNYTPAATESIATREWVENYIANNMPTYPAAEGVEF